MSETAEHNAPQDQVLRNIAGGELPPLARNRKEPVMVGDLVIGYVQHIAVGMWAALGADGKQYGKLTDGYGQDGEVHYDLFGPWKAQNGIQGYLDRDEAESLVHLCWEPKTKHEKRQVAIQHYQRLEAEYLEACAARLRGGHPDLVVEAKQKMDQAAQELADLA